MTKEFADLTEKIKVAVQKNVDLEQKKKELIADLKETERKNYTMILHEELGIYQRIVTDLRAHFDCTVKFDDRDSSYNGLKLMYRMNDEEAFIQCHYDGFTTYLSLCEGHGLSQFNSFSESDVRAIADYLGSEEKTMQTLEYVRKGYAEIFNQYLTRINKENEGLYSTVEELTKLLADSTVMEEKEDGTVEIHLGGKTFRGKVVEE